MGVGDCCLFRNSVELPNYKVASFTGEDLSVDKYCKAVRKAYISSFHNGLATGLGLGTVMFLMFSAYSFAIWYGGKLILIEEKGYTGALVINVIVAIMISTFSLGQLPPCLLAFSAGQAAAYKMFETINRKPVIDAYDKTGKTLNDIRGDIEFRDVACSRVITQWSESEESNYQEAKNKG